MLPSNGYSPAWEWLDDWQHDALRDWWGNSSRLVRESVGAPDWAESWRLVPVILRGLAAVGTWYPVTRDALGFPVPNGGGEIGPVRSGHRERQTATVAV